MMEKMKEEYVNPKVELLEFDHNYVILTSRAPYGNCRTGGSYSEVGVNCNTTYERWMADVAS